MTDQPPAPPRTPVPLGLRVASLLVFAIALGLWFNFFGLPKQPFLVIAFMWLGVIAWDVRRPLRAHLEFARDWWPPLVLLAVYMYSRGVADELGFDVHFTEPIRFDEWLFGGTLPTEYLQAKLCGVPCTKSLPPRWYDVALTTVYYSHFFATLGLAVWLWLRDRFSWVRYVRRYLSLCVVALIGYVVYPMAPPWMAARDGYLTSDIHRITGRGWWDLGKSGGSTGQQKLATVGNQVAAMPSLHTALALFVAVFLIMRLRSTWRWMFLLYPAAMSFLLVYYAEHYVLDILAGYLVVAVVMVGWGLWERRSGTDQGSTIPTQSP